MLAKRTPGAPLSEAEVKQRRDAARARWEGAAAGAAGGAIGAAGLAAGAGWYRDTTAASELAAGKIRAERFRQGGERQVQAYAARAREIDSKISRPWPLRLYAQHLRGKTARLDREWEEFNAGRGPLPKPRDTYQGLKDRFARRREQLMMETHAASTVVPPKGKAYVAGAKGTKVPERLQGSATDRLMGGWIDPEARGKRTPLLWPTQPDIDQMRRDLREEIPKRQSWFAPRARARAERQAGQAAAAGFGAARATLRRWPKVTGGRIAALGTLGALAGGAAAWAARKPVEKLAKGVVVHSGRELDAVAAVARSPRSLAEAEAGNYRKAHVRLHGLEIAIETPRGADRIGWAKDGRVKWRATMPAHYGYVKGTEGHDGDAIDVYLLPGALDASRPVYVFDQVRLPSGEFDEHKVVLGATSEAEATRIYDRGFSDGSGPKRRRAVTRMTLAEFKAWLPAVDGPLAKAAPTDPTDPTDDGAFDRPEPSDDQNSSSSSSAPGPTQDRISRALGRLFDRWLRDPRTIGDQKRVEDALKPMQDAFKAGADRERLKNEGQAYANDVIPKARGTAARLAEEADGYRARVIAQAVGDAERFRAVLTEYQKAPAVTRDRLYLDTMTQVYSNVSKVLVDSRSGSNLLYLPLDKLMQASAPPAAPPVAATPADPSAGSNLDPRSREGLRGRERELR